MAFRLLVLLALAVLCASALAQTSPSNTIAQNLAARSDLSDLYSVVNRTQFQAIFDLLNNPNVRLTLFAPNNAAFDRLPSLPSDDDLLNFLYYHIHDGVILANSLAPLQFPVSLLTNASYVNLGQGKGQVLHVTKSPITLVFGIPGNPNDTAFVRETDISSFNGVIHIIDTVMSAPQPTTATALEAGLSELVYALNRTKLLNTVDNTTAITLFAPTNAVITEANWRDLTDEDLSFILKNHIVRGVVYSTELYRCQNFETLLDQKVTVTASSPFKINGVGLVLPNILVKNGAIHIINGVLSTASYVFAGVMLAVSGNLMISVALNIQKFSHNKNQMAAEKRSYLRQPTWWLGMSLMGLGELGNFGAYALAPASIVSPLGTVALVSNAIIAPIVLKERFRPQDLLGSLIAIGGAIVVVIFAGSSHSSGGFTEELVREAFKKPSSIVFMCITLPVAFGLMFATRYIQRKYLLLEMAQVAIHGGYTVVATKAVSELLFNEFPTNFTYWIFYVMLLVMIVTIVLQIRALQEALQHFDSTEVIPANFVCFTIGTLTASGIIYDDFACMSGLDITFFCCGCLLTFIGVYFITAGRKSLKKSATQLGVPSVVSRAAAGGPMMTQGCLARTLQAVMCVSTMRSSDAMVLTAIECTFIRRSAFIQWWAMEGGWGGQDSTELGDDKGDESAPLISQPPSYLDDGKPYAAPEHHDGGMHVFSNRLRDVTETTMESIMKGIRARRDLMALPLEQVITNYESERMAAMPTGVQGTMTPGTEAIPMGGYASLNPDAMCA